MATFGERLRELRNERGLKQAEVGAVVGVSYNTISKWETGEREPDTKNKKGEENFDANKVYYTLADFFEVPLLYLLGASDDRRWGRLSDEEAAAVFEAEEKEMEDQMLKLYQDLSIDMQEVVRSIVATLWKTEKQRGQLQSQQEE